MSIEYIPQYRAVGTESEWLQESDSFAENEKKAAVAYTRFLLRKDPEGYRLVKRTHTITNEVIEPEDAK